MAVSIRLNAKIDSSHLRAALELQPLPSGGSWAPEGTRAGCTI